MIREVQSRFAGCIQDPISRLFYRNRLVFNACWEDPRIDRQLLALGNDSKVAMITSAGCNALDYLLDSPAEIHCVDINPRQNALMELKLALIKKARFEDLFAMFGNGYHPAYRCILAGLRDELSPFARNFWDKKGYYFDQRHFKRSFYFHGTVGEAAWLINRLILEPHKQLRHQLYAMLDAKDLETQRAHYSKIESKYWNAFTSWLLRQPVVLTMLGTPQPQLRLAEKGYPGGMTAYLRDRIRHVATQVPMRDNYFWRVFVNGKFTSDCCPNYLKPENFDILRTRVDRIRLYTDTMVGFLKSQPGPYSHFVLLDHQDWLVWHAPHVLREEWRLILQNSRPGTRIIMRSVSADSSFVPVEARSRLRFFPDLTQHLHQLDRVGTYRSLHFAEVV